MWWFCRRSSSSPAPSRRSCSASDPGCSVHALATYGVGDICGRFYDARGKAVNGALADRTLAVGLDVLKTRPLRIGVAAGAERVEALRGAFVGELANAVVTDTGTAAALLEPEAG